MKMNLWRYEHRTEALASRRTFLRRIAAHGGIAVVLAAVSLAVGMVGYRYTEGMSWLDAYINAAMILSGMGPAREVGTAAGKLFAGTYALFSGVVFLLIASVMVAPLAHRLLHGLHMADVPSDESDDGAAR